MFGIVQKDQMGCAPRCSAHAAEPDLRLFLPARAVRSLDKAIEETKYRMSRYSVTPNMLYAAALAVARGCAISCWL